METAEGFEKKMCEKSYSTFPENDPPAPDFSEETVMIDDYGLPFEAIDEFSDAPLEFEELTVMLWEDMMKTYTLAVRYNRHSPHYLKLCDHLEKNIKHMGSLCVTKAVLEQNGFFFPKLEAVSITELYSMVSLHFRKTHAAFRDLTDNHKGFDMNLLDRICRWAALAERLKATGEKINKICSGKINSAGLLEREHLFRKMRHEKRPEMNLPEDQNIRSLPIIGSYAREMVKSRKKEAFSDRREKIRHEREQKKTGPYRGYHLSEVYKPVPFEDPEKFTEFLRKELTDEAKDRGDTDAVREIRNENFLQLQERWERFTGSFEKPLKRPDPSACGPSDEIRKKLREKRKKKKKG